MNQVIEIVVNPRGEATVQTRGFTGGECREASRFLEQALADGSIKLSIRVGGAQ